MSDTNGQDKQILAEDRCVCCGGPVPEGYMVCHGCIMEQNYQKRVSQWKRKQRIMRLLGQAREVLARFRRKK